MWQLDRSGKAWALASASLRLSPNFVFDSSLWPNWTDLANRGRWLAHLSGFLLTLFSIQVCGNWTDLAKRGRWLAHLSGFLLTLFSTQVCGLTGQIWQTVGAGERISLAFS